MKPDLFWIPGPWRGRLSISTRPRGGDWLESEVAGWRDEGLNAIVSLLESDEAAELGLENERSVTESYGLQFLSLPIPDLGVPNSTGDALKAVSELVTMLAEGRNVAVHCRQGVGRSGLVAAAALIASGMEAGEAVQLVSRARRAAVPETRAQLQWLENLTPERVR
jgi:protein-tyrosine phosphatase